MLVQPNTFKQGPHTHIQLVHKRMVGDLGINVKLHARLFDPEHKPSCALPGLHLHCIKLLLELLWLQPKHQLHLVAEAIPVDAGSMVNLLPPQWSKNNRPKSGHMHSAET